MKFLVVAAHPDDEVLGCGATIGRWARDGHEVSVAILGEGITSRFARPADADPQALANLRQATDRASRIMGTTRLYQHDLPDNRFDTVPLLEVIKLVENIIGQVSPDVVYTHHAGDLNIDHVIVNRAVLTATRPISDRGVAEVYTFEVPSSSEWSFGRLQSSFQPNTFVRVSETLHLKLEAMAAYDGECRRYPHPRSARALTAIASRWGSVVGVDAAEAFELVRAIR